MPDPASAETSEPCPPATTPPRDRNLPALTGLRFILALWVILHHLAGKNMMIEPWVRSLPSGLQAFIHGGYLAVGTFFVLSGFVLARSYSTASWNRGSLIRYGVARIARVYPAYLLSLAIVSPFIFDWCFPTGRTGPAPAEQVAQLANYGFVLQGWAAKRAVFWNTPAWSLSCELFFYLCFPLVAACLSARTWPRILATVAGCLALPTFLVAISVPAPWKPVHHMADFLLGIAASAAYDWIVQSRILRRGFWLYAPAAAAGTAIVSFPALVERWMTLNGALRPINMALLIGLALGGGFPARALSSKLAGYLGKASYSMYILHIPLLWWFKRCWLYRSGILSQNGCALVYIAGVVAVSTAASEWFEEPANRRIRNWVGARLRAGHASSR
jgi:peptidoglycan/LPS O-acetylase OafA/YrhL